MSERTHQPTNRKRQEARREGRVAASSQVGGAFVWLTLFSVALVVGEPIRQHVIEGFRGAWSGSWHTHGHADAMQRLQQCLCSVGVWLLPLLGILMVISLCCRVAQVGFLWTPQRLFAGSVWRQGPSGTDLLFHFVRGLLLIATAMIALTWGIWQANEDLVKLPLISATAASGHHLLASWGLRMGLILAAFAVLDYGYQRYRLERSLAMTPDEVRDEVKAIEGNWQVAAGRKNLQQSMHSNDSR